jgi:hypothetical protein
MKDLFYWRGMKQEVEDFVKQCSICQHAKHSNSLPPGLLQPLPIPQGAWQDLSMDFIEGLPKSKGFNVILVIVDRFTKYAHFVPIRHPFTTRTIAKAVFDNVVKLHGLPRQLCLTGTKCLPAHFGRNSSV